MKKLDKLILTSFFGPFFITFFVVVFILLTQFMLKYFDEIVGKDLGVEVIAQLIFYFSINMTQNALPLAVLLSALMTFGNLGEHFELTAIKSSGISLLRVMRPLFLVTCILVVIGFFNNNYIIPKANLEAFSLLYDIKQKKPALDIKEGMFYDGIPGFSIKINEKFADDETLKDIIIYSHNGPRGNKEVTLADSGKMYNILENSYLVLELFKGRSYSEQQAKRRRFNNKDEANPYLRSEFQKRKIVFSLSEFDLKRTRKELFTNNRLMKNIDELRSDLDSMYYDYDYNQDEVLKSAYQFYTFHMKEELKAEMDSLNQKRRGDTSQVKKNIIKVENSSDTEPTVRDVRGEKPEETRGENNDTKRDLSSRKDALHKVDSIKKIRKGPRISTELKGNISKNLKNDTLQEVTIDSLKESDSTELSMVDQIDSVALVERSNIDILDSMLSTDQINEVATSKALQHIRYVKGNLTSKQSQLHSKFKQIKKFEIERYKKLAMALTILAMFLIGAPLGAIIKRGGMGLPVLISIFFFVLFYVISMLGEKWARQGLIDPLYAVWLANFVLFPIGAFFLKQARKDAPLFEVDFYLNLWKKLKKRVNAQKQ